MSKRKQLQTLIRSWKDETGAHEIDMREVAKWAHKKGWPLPTPADPMDMLTKQFTEAAREDIEYDKRISSTTRIPANRFASTMRSGPSTEPRNSTSLLISKRRPARRCRRPW